MLVYPYFLIFLAAQSLRRGSPGRRHGMIWFLAVRSKRVRRLRFDSLRASALQQQALLPVQELTVALLAALPSHPCNRAKISPNAFASRCRLSSRAARIARMSASLCNGVIGSVSVTGVILCVPVVPSEEISRRFWRSIVPTVPKDFLSFLSGWSVRVPSAAPKPSLHGLGFRVSGPSSSVRPLPRLGRPVPC